MTGAKTHDELLFIVGPAGIALARFIREEGEPLVVAMTPDVIPTWQDIFDALKDTGIDMEPVVRVRSADYQQALLDAQRAGGPGRVQ